MQDFKHIISRDNPTFKHLVRIANLAKERKQQHLTLLDGVHLIEAYLNQIGLPEQIILPEGKSSDEAIALLEGLADVPTILLPTLLFAEITPVTNSTGILALVRIPEIPLPNDISMGLMLEDIQDPGNLGSMLRTAAAAGLDVVYLSKGCTDPWSPKALRGGQGAQFVLPVVRDCDLLALVEQFQGECFAMTMQGEDFYQQSLEGAIMWIIGNEGAGISLALKQRVDKCLTIPMAHQNSHAVESLNAAAALAVVLFESRRQKLNK